jgi:hypothetical protein
MNTYTLTSKARPRLGSGQATRLYDVMEELSGGPVTLDQIVERDRVGTSNTHHFYLVVISSLKPMVVESQSRAAKT